jgi:hypothetical protein
MRADSSDRSTMIGVFSQRFPDLSRRELGKLFDKYRLIGRIGIRWDGRSGQYIIDWHDCELERRERLAGCHTSDRLEKAYSRAAYQVLFSSC